jgi:acyl-[acyl-carrier-protein]-phospholipid O-acyltransferase/long-chain-fatty-acid--[acyl-carrier-protein] ligase
VHGFALYGQLGYSGLLVVLFLMGTQSAFFGPGKYGILPEMLRERDLPRANGVIVMTTFLAIIFGTASAGLLGDWFVLEFPDGQRDASRLWIGSLFCIVIAAAGTITSLLIRRTPRAKPELRFCWSTLAIPPDTRAMLARDRKLVATLLASCVFWLVSGIAIQAVNSLGLVQLELSKMSTSIMTAVIGIGIAIGAVIAGRMCHGRADFRIVYWGQWGMVALLGLMSISLPGPDQTHLLGFRGSLPVLALLGMAAGFFAIPLQVFLQARPPEDQKGRMIAVMNQANFMAILLSGLLYALFDRIVVALEWPRSTIFAFMMLLLLPMAVLFRLKSDD